MNKKKLMIASYLLAVLIMLILLVLTLKGVEYMEHEKVYVICENLCMEEGMTKGQIENLVNDVDSDVTDLEGTVDFLNSTTENLVYMVDGLYSSKANVNDVKFKGDFALIEGSINLTANTSELRVENRYTATDKDISFPNGFNKDNCVVVAIGKRFDNNRGYTFGDIPDNEFLIGQITGSYPLNISLGIINNNNVIRLTGYNAALETKTIHYKIVLMKIS